MACDGDETALIGAGEMSSVVVDAIGRPHAVALAMQRDRRHRDRRLERELRLDGVQRRIARCGTVAMAVGLDYDLHKVGVVERSRGLPVGRVIETVIGRPQLPKQPAQRASVRRQPGTPSFGVEIPLVPTVTAGWRVN